MTPLLKFFALTFAITWTLFFAAGTVPGGASASQAVRELLFLPGTVAPALVALWLTWRGEGRAGLRALVDRLFDARARARWYLFAVGYMAAIKIGVALVHRVATGGWPRFGDEAWFVIALAIVFSTPVQAGEEIGWRGYALPRLAERFGLARASVLLGVIWACWHLPLFFIAGTDKIGQSFPVYLAQVTALSVAMTWLYAHTRGSLLLVMLMHSAINQASGIVPSAAPGAADPFALTSSLVAWLTAALLWVCAGYFLVRMPGVNQASGSLSRSNVE